MSYCHRNPYIYGIGVDALLKAQAGAAELELRTLAVSPEELKQLKEPKPNCEKRAERRRRERQEAKIIKAEIKRLQS